MPYIKLIAPKIALHGKGFTHKVSYAKGINPPPNKSFPLTTIGVQHILRGYAVFGSVY
jgi:hypothetical protein